MVQTDCGVEYQALLITFSFIYFLDLFANEEDDDEDDDGELNIKICINRNKKCEC